MALSTTLTRLTTPARVAGLPKAFVLADMLALPEVTACWIASEEYFAADLSTWTDAKNGLVLSAALPGGSGDASANVLGFDNGGNTPYIELSSTNAARYEFPAGAASPVSDDDHSLVYGFMPVGGNPDDVAAPYSTFDQFSIVDSLVSSRFLSAIYDRDSNRVGQFTEQSNGDLNALGAGTHYNDQWHWYCQTHDDDTNTGYIEQNGISRDNSAAVFSSLNSNANGLKIGHHLITQRLSVIMALNADISAGYGGAELIAGIMNGMHYSGD